MQLRPYQQEAKTAIYQYLRCHKTGNPVAVLPTGSGKTPLLSAICSDAVQKWLPPALSLFVPLLALGLYLQVGRPGLPAAPFAERGTEQPAPSTQ